MSKKTWNARDCLSRCFPEKKLACKKIDIERVSQEDITFEVLMQAYQTMASIVNCYGDIYLPLFERLHDEIKEQRSKNELLKLAKTIENKKLSTGNKNSNMC